MNDLTTVRMSYDEWWELEPWEGVHSDEPDGKKYKGTYAGNNYVVTLHKREDGSAYSTSTRVVHDDDG